MTGVDPPRGEKVAAWARWVILALVTALAGFSVWTFWGPQRDAHHEESHEDRYFCPMHPQIRSHDPGECPICHMTLERIPAERKLDAAPASTSRPAGLASVSLDAAKQRSAGLSVSVVRNEALDNRLRVPAIITAPESGRSEVRVRAAGFVERLAVRQAGVRVAQGQTLAWVFSPEIYKAQEEFLELSRWNSEGAGKESAQGTDMATAARRGLELLGLTKADIDDISKSGKAQRALPVRAPSSGYVTRFNAVLGSRANPETALYEIADLSTVWVVASLNERDLLTIHAGDRATFTTSAGQTVQAKVELIEPELDQATRTARVRLVVPNADALLRPGEYGDVEFSLKATEGLLVPREAVVRTGQAEYVYVESAPDTFEPRLVQTGAARGELVVVTSGLQADDRVVTRGSFMLDSESRLKASLAGTGGSSGTEH